MSTADDRKRILNLVSALHPSRMVLLACWLAAASLLALASPALALTQPHGGYTEVSSKCEQCHSPHEAYAGDGEVTEPGTTLLFPVSSTVKGLCYTCHDGTGSIYDVRSQFGEAGESRESSHPVATDRISCSDCHIPHMGPDEGNPRSLRAGPSHESTGNAVCGGCHGADSALPGGNLLANYVGTSHDTSMPSPPSGTQIKCLGCHVPHGSDNAALIATAVVSLSETTRTVSVESTTSSRPLCVACHDAKRNAFGGPEAYAAAKHAVVASSSLAATGYPGAGVIAGDCENCHEPHGTGFPQMLRASGQTLCYTCHDASGAARPATYSYQGATTFASSAHEGLPSAGSATPTSGSGCVVCHAVHGGGELSWEATLPAGALWSPENRLCLGSGEGGCHASASASASGQNILGKLTASASSTSHHDVLAGDQQFSGSRIKCSDCHNVHRDSSASTYSDPDNIGVGLTSAFDRYLDANGQLYALVGAEHDGVAPVISNVAVDTTLSGSARVSWGTDEQATSWVDLGTSSAAYDVGSFGADSPLTAAHTVDLPDIVAGEEYYFRLRSTDALGNGSVSAQMRFNSASTLSGTPTATPVLDQFTGTGGTRVTLTWEGVTCSDGDTTQYYVEITNGGANTYTSGWITGTSWQTPNLRFATWTWKVKARDPIHVNAASPYCAPDSFVVQYWEVLNELDPLDSLAPTQLWADATLPTGRALVLDLFGLDEAPIAPAGGPLLGAGNVAPSYQVAVAEPTEPEAVFSVDTDQVSILGYDSDAASYSFFPLAGWQKGASVAGAPTPTLPGQAVDQSALDAASAVDADYWITDLASGDRTWNWQMTRFAIPTEQISDLQELSLLWRGHGEPTAGYATKLYLWDRIASVWVEVGSRTALGEDATIETARILATSNAFCLRCHDGTVPSGVVMPSSVTVVGTVWTTLTGSDFHGPRVGSGASVSTGGLSVPYSRGGEVSCRVCHDPHGSENPYALPRYINGVDTSATPQPNRIAAACSACHTGGTSAWHAGCISCHSNIGVDPDDPHSQPTVDLSETAVCTDCHRHGSKTVWGTTGMIGAPGCGRAGHSNHCHTFATLF